MSAVYDERFMDRSQIAGLGQDFLWNAALNAALASHSVGSAKTADALLLRPKIDFDKYLTDILDIVDEALTNEPIKGSMNYHHRPPSKPNYSEVNVITPFSYYSPIISCCEIGIPNKPLFPNHDIVCPHFPCSFFFSRQSNATISSA